MRPFLQARRHWFSWPHTCQLRIGYVCRLRTRTRIHFVWPLSFLFSASHPVPPSPHPSLRSRSSSIATINRPDFFHLFTRYSAWQSQDMAPPSNGGGISIPTHDTVMGNSSAGGDDQAWANGGGRSPSRGNGEPPRRSSRSRSPGPRGDDRGSVCTSTFVGRTLTRVFSGRGDGGQNPGNNLHVSGLSHKVDTRELEQAFAKVGRVCFLACHSGTMAVTEMWTHTG